MYRSLQLPSNRSLSAIVEHTIMHMGDNCHEGEERNQSGH